MVHINVVSLCEFTNRHLVCHKYMTYFYQKYLINDKTILPNSPQPSLFNTLYTVTKPSLIHQHAVTAAQGNMAKSQTLRKIQHFPSSLAYFLTSAILCTHQHETGHQKQKMIADIKNFRLNISFFTTPHTPSQSMVAMPMQ